jgi:Zn-dependent protease with chaperone function
VRLPGDKGWTRRRWVGVSVGLAATLGLAVLALNGLPRWVADAIPVSWEQRLGEPTEALVTASKARCTGEAGQAALERLVGRLRAAGPIAMPVTISVFEDRMINAFTLPGGHVLVMRGLIAEAADGPMLAGVIAHELGHVAHRDPTTLMLRGLGLSLLLHMMGLGDTGGTAAAGASNLMNLAYTRAAEAAADATAIDLLTKAGLRADGLSRFFALMEKREGAAGGDAGKGAGHASEEAVGTTPDWFATHPPSELRRERTARPEVGEMPFTEAEWQAIRTMCGVGDRPR